jgi:flavin reductase (DIM6/NTAB) family NADH-FMN oxidoreductase RutF
MKASDMTASSVEEGCPIDPAVYRSVLGRYATGVTVITVGGSGMGKAGVTANSFTTVSLNPPLILWSLSLKAPSLPLFRAHQFFGVSILAAHQRTIASHFARPAPDKFAGIETFTGQNGMPLIEGAVAHVECRVESRYPGGDHEIIMGRVLKMEGSEDHPLVFHGGRFCGVAAGETLSSVS